MSHQVTILITFDVYHFREEDIVLKLACCQ